MSTPSDSRATGIGVALKDARRQIGMDIKEAEERTKIRARYLRALEAEDWEVLPEPAYVRGFLRTYGGLVGLDGEALADEFRRRHEPPEGVAGSPPDPILQERRRPPGPRPPSRGPLIVAIAVAIVVLLVILAYLGTGSDDPSPPPKGKPPRASLKTGGDKGKKSARKSPKPLVPIDLTVEPIDAIQLCLVGGSKEALIDGQSLAAGTTERFADYKRYRLDLAGAGAVKLTAGKSSQRLLSQKTASFEADSRGIRAIEPAGPDCP